MNLARLFDPGSIAVVGASATEGKLGYEAMKNVADFEGPLYPVNPNADGEVFGQPFVARIGDVPEAVDLALVAVPAPAVPEVIEECGEAGVGAAIVYAGGFAEAGEQGAKLQDRLVDAAEAHDIALLGPNISGYFLPHQGVFTTFSSETDRVQPGNVAVIAQSGGLAHSMAFQGVNSGYGYSGIVGLGNRAVIGFEPVIEYFDSDPRTDAILLHVEGTENARHLLETCERAETPIAALPVGEHDVDDFAASHTGALTGDFALYEAGFRQYGVPVVRSTQTLLDAGHALADAPVPDGWNVGVITGQAGPGIVIADRLQGHGATLPKFTEETQETVAEILPGITFAENPVDTGRPMPEFPDLIETVARDPNVDAVLVYMVYEKAVGFPPTEIAGLPDEIDKPILLVTDGPNDLVRTDIDAMESRGIPSFQVPERGADALGALLEYGELSRQTAADGGADR